MKNEIALYTVPGCWIAEFIGPHAIEMVKLFGQAELPLPFTERALPSEVLASISTRYPNVHVFLKVTK